MNAEQGVLDAIAALEATDDLVDWQLSRREQRSGYDFNVNQASCPVCTGDWHGLDNGRCPGAWATPEQQGAYHERQRATRSRFFDLHTDRPPLDRPTPERFVQFGEFQIGRSADLPPGTVRFVNPLDGLPLTPGGLSVLQDALDGGQADFIATLRRSLLYVAPVLHHPLRVTGIASSS